MSKTVKAHIAIFIVGLIYGLNYLIAKDVMQGYIQPRGFIFLRVIGASVLFWLFHSSAKAEKIESDRKAEEAAYLASVESNEEAANIKVSGLALAAKYISWGALAACLYMGVSSYVNQDIATITSWLIVPTLIYFITATYAYIATQAATNVSENLESATKPIEAN